MAFSYKDYEESDAVRKKREELEKQGEYRASDAVNLAKQTYDNYQLNKPAEWNGGTYGEALNNAISNLQNREKFSYDLNADAIYQQYKDQYINQGRLAMQDTIGQASALTGGYGNSYAAAVGNQAYQNYLTKLNDIVPDLYNAAYQRYQDEGQGLKDQYSILANQYNTEYGQYRDTYSDYQNELARLENAYQNERNFDYGQYVDTRDYLTNAYNNERSYDYNLYSDAYNRAFNSYQQDTAEAQWQKEFEEQQRQWNADYALAQAKLYSSGSGSGGSNSGASLPSAVEKRLAEMESDDDKAEYLDSLVAAGVINEGLADNAYATYKGVGMDASPSLMDRKWTAVGDGGTNWLGGIDRNATVQDQYGTNYTLANLKKALKDEGISSKDAQNYIIELQKKLGI